MAEQEQLVTVPDIGSDDKVEVIEINVKVGDTVSVEDTLITLESEKASMEIPSPNAGVVTSILVKVGDKVSTGSQILTIQSASKVSTDNSKTSSVTHSEAPPTPPVAQDTKKAESVASTLVKQPEASSAAPAHTKAETVAVNIPDIGTDSKVEVIEISVKPGDKVAKEDSLLTLESEKASMDIPAPFAGVIKDIVVKVGDKVAVGDLILHLTTATESSAESSTPESTATLEDGRNIARSMDERRDAKAVESQKLSATATTQHTIAPSVASARVAADNKHVYASPSVRRFANDLGVHLHKVVGTGRKNRIIQSDVEHYVKTELAKTQSGNFSAGQGNGLGLEIAKLPEVDFSKFGSVTEQPLKRIQKLSAANLHRNWVTIPHVTQFDEADITDMESFRLKYKKQAEAKGYKLTPLVFLMRAAAQALKLMPQFNVSLSNDGVNIIQKHYYHIGIAVDTPNGLVVPVVRDVDQKGLFQLAAELAEISQKARDGKLQAKDMQGGCFSISSLGGIGGTAFTPIINAPEVAILGISKSQMKPVYSNGEFVPRLMLPLSLSYDHRAIDGAAAAKFITLYSQLLGDISQLLL